MPQGEKIHQRKNYFIKKDFQAKFILKFCLLLLAGVIVSMALLFFFSQDTLTSSFHNSRLVIKNTGLVILPSIVYTGLITLVLLTIGTVIVILFISHKIAGPMFRFEKELREIGEGNLTKKVLLRNKDQAAELADAINEMTATLQKKVFSIQTELERIREAARQQNVPLDHIEDLDRLSQKFKHDLKT